MMLLSFLAVGTLWFWLALLAAGVAIAELADRDKGGSATLVAVATLGLLYVCGDFNPVTLVLDHPLWAPIAILVYLAAGSAWGVAKWTSYSYALRRRAERLAAEFLTARNLPEDGAIPDDERTQREWKSVLESNGIRGSLPPKVRQNRTRIISWMCWWPASMAWTLLNDPVRRAFVAIYDGLGNTLQRISDRAWNGADRLMPKEAGGKRADA